MLQHVQLHAVEHVCYMYATRRALYPPVRQGWYFFWNPHISPLGLLLWGSHKAQNRALGCILGLGKVCEPFVGSTMVVRYARPT